MVETRVYACGISFRGLWGEDGTNERPLIFYWLNRKAASGALLKV